MKEDEKENESVHWISDARGRFSNNVISKGIHTMREHIIRTIRKVELGGPDVVLFGGLVRRSILSSSLIKKYIGDKLNETEYKKKDRTVKWAEIESFELPVDTFVSVDADVDIYIDKVQDRNDENIVTNLVESIKNESYDVGIVDGFENYGGCTRVKVRTHNHPLAPRLNVNLDIVTRNSSKGPVFPDFTCNQLAVTMEGELQLFKVSSMPYIIWWEVPHIDKFVPIENDTTGYSFAAGELDKKFFIIRNLRAQVERKEGHVLMYKFTAWSECRSDNNVSSSRSEYLKYVLKLVCYRLPKLLFDDWKIFGFACELVHEGLRCKKNHITSFGDLQFGFEGDDVVEFADENNELTDEPSFYCTGCDRWHDIVVKFVD